MELKINLLYVIDSLGIGGAERQLVELIKGIIAHNYEIHLIALEPKKNSYETILSRIGIHPTYIPRNSRYDVIKPVNTLIKFVKLHDIHLIHTFLNMGSFYGSIAALLTGKPIVCSAIRDGKDKSWKEKILKLFFSRCSDIFVSNSYSGFTNRFNKMKSHFRVVYNGIDFERDSYSEEELNTFKKELGIHQFKHTIGMVASMINHKDHDTLIRAIPGILKKKPDTCFLLIGDGYRRRDLEEATVKSGISNHVFFTGFRKDVDKLYRIMDISILLTNTDIHLEGISNVLIESMLCETPVIATKGGGTDELIENRKTGLIIDPHNSIELENAVFRLLNDMDLSKMLCWNAKEMVHNKFSLRQYTDNYIDIYKSVLE